MKPRTRFAVVAAAALMLAGCSSHFHVTEPQSGRQYLTKQVNISASGGAIFDDAVTGSRVTLASSEVREIGESEYRELLAVRREQAERASEKAGE